MDPILFLSYLRTMNEHNDSVFCDLSTANPSSFYPSTTSDPSEITESNLEENIFKDNIYIPNNGVPPVPPVSLQECDSSADPQLGVIALNLDSTASNNSTPSRRRGRPKKSQNVSLALDRKRMHNQSASRSRHKVKDKVKALVDLVPRSHFGERKLTEHEKFDLLINYVRELQSRLQGCKCKTMKMVE